MQKPEKKSHKRKTPAPAPVIPDAIAADLLRGARQIAAFIGRNEGYVYHLAKTKGIPLSREGAILIGSKRDIRRHYGIPEEAA